MRLTQEQSFKWLLSEYSRSHETLRYYDGLRESLVKFGLSVLSILGVTGTTVRKFTPDSGLLSGILFLIGGLVSLMVSLMLAQNRCYIALTARQINSIRKVFVEACPVEYENWLYTDPRFPPMWRFRSIHIQTLIFFILMTACFMGVAVWIWTGAICWGILASLLIGGALTSFIRWVFLREVRPC